MSLHLCILDACEAVVAPFFDFKFLFVCVSIYKDTCIICIRLCFCVCMDFAL